MISHAELVESIFGYFPEFADGRIELFSFEQPGVIRLRIFYIDSQINNEPPRDLRRLQLLREWSHEQVYEVFP